MLNDRTRRVTLTSRQLDVKDRSRDATWDSLRGTQRTDPPTDSESDPHSPTEVGRGVVVQWLNGLTYNREVVGSMLGCDTTM